MKEAGDAYMKQGEMMELIGERDESSSCYINASKCYKTEFPKGEKDTNVEAVNALKLGISILTEKGCFFIIQDDFPLPRPIKSKLLKF